VALIELDLYEPVPPPVRRRPPVRLSRYPALAVAVGLAFVLGGAAPARSVLLQAQGTAPLTLHGSYELLGGRLYTFDASPDGTLTTSAWSPAPVRRLWQTTNRVVVDNTGMPTGLGLGWHATPIAGDGVLLQADHGSRVIDARTGTVRWSLDRPMTAYAGGRVGIVLDETYGPTNDNEDVHLGGDGQLHAGPPLETRVRVFDLRSGSQLWTSTYESGVLISDIPGEPDTLLVLTPDRLRRVTARTGAIQRDQALDGSADTVSGGMIVQGQVVVSDGEGDSYAVHSPRTLARLWADTALSPTLHTGGACDNVLCDFTVDGVTVLDPATGAPRWTAGLGSTIVGQGNVVGEINFQTSQPQWIRDRVTGRNLVDLRPWNWITPTRDDGSILLGKPENGGTIFGYLPAGSTTIQTVGRIPDPITSCRADAASIVCLTGSGIKVWSYRSGTR
jgi:hypothetical protein